MKANSNYMSLDYQLIRSQRRKTIAIQVRDAQVIVRAPVMIDEHYINKFLAHKESWLRAKIKQQRLLIPSGSLMSTPVLILGELYSIKLAFGDKQICLDKENKQIKVILSKRFIDADEVIIEQQLTKALLKYFKDILLQYIDRRLPELSRLAALVPSKTQVRKYRTRWGSCNSRKELSFNTLLVQAPAWVVDYVILHELCHLKYMNHSTKFWQLLASYSQDIKKAKAWLAEHQYQFLKC